MLPPAAMIFCIANVDVLILSKKFVLGGATRADKSSVSLAMHATSLLRMVGARTLALGALVGDGVGHPIFHVLVLPLVPAGTRTFVVVVGVDQLFRKLLKIELGVERCVLPTAGLVEEI